MALRCMMPSNMEPSVKASYALLVAYMPPSLLPTYMYRAVTPSSVRPVASVLGTGLFTFAPIKTKLSSSLLHHLLPHLRP